MRIVRRFLGEESGLAERTVDLVGRDVQEAEAVLGGAGEFLEVTAGGLEHREGADDVGLDEGAGAVDRTVDMALGGEMHDPVRLELRKEPANGGGVTDVGLGETIAGIGLKVVERVPVAGVSQRIHIEHRVLRGGDEQADKVAADEAGAAGDQDVHGNQVALTQRRRSRSTASCTSVILMPVAASLAEVITQLERGVLARGAHEFGLAGEKLEVLVRDAGFFDEAHDLAGGDMAGIGDVVDAEGHALFPAGEGGFDEFIQLRDRIGRVEQGRVALHLRQVIARVVHLVERNAQTPDIDVGPAGEHLLAQRLGAGIEAAVVGAKREVGRVGFGETSAIGPRAGVDATGGDMAPRHARVGTRLGDRAGKDAVAHEALGFVQFAGVDVGLAGVAGGVDQENRLLPTKEVGERDLIGIVKISPADVAEGQAFALKQCLISRADITGASEQIDHMKSRVKREVAGLTRDIFRAVFSDNRRG